VFPGKDVTIYDVVDNAARLRALILFAFRVRRSRGEIFNGYGRPVASRPLGQVGPWPDL